MAWQSTDMNWSGSSSAKIIPRKAPELCNKENEPRGSEFNQYSPAYSSVARHDTIVNQLSDHDKGTLKTLEYEAISNSVGSLESLAENANGYQKLLTSM